MVKLSKCYEETNLRSKTHSKCSKKKNTACYKIVILKNDNDIREWHKTFLKELQESKIKLGRKYDPKMLNIRGQ